MNEMQCNFLIDMHDYSDFTDDELTLLKQRLAQMSVIEYCTVLYKHMIDIGGNYGISDNDNYISKKVHNLFIELRKLENE